VYGKSASLRCGGKLFHSPGLAAAKALTPKVLWVRVTTHVQLSVERSRRSRSSATRQCSIGAVADGCSTVHYSDISERNEMQSAGVTLLCFNY